MNRIDRLFAYLLKLGSSPLVRGAELAREFGISVRTVYRDFQSLGEMGVPIVAQAGHGYSIGPGFFVPPLLFTADEAKDLHLALHLYLTHVKLPSDSPSKRALTKIDAILSPSTRSKLKTLDAILDFVRPAVPLDWRDRNLARAMEAVENALVVRLRYRPYDSSRATERTIEPVKLSYAAGTGVWYLDAYCRSRQAFRSFRLDRAASLVVTNERFRPRERFEDSFAAIEGTVAAVLVVSRTQARWIEEKQHWTFVSRIDRDGDRYAYAYRVPSIDAFVPWVLSVSPWVEAYEGDELCAGLRESLGRISTLLT